MPQSKSKVFISYAHDDRPLAERLARSLVSQGQDVWWDGWEIAAGDSLIKKIFAEGLANAKAFAILLSPSSVSSKWVQEELNTATLRRIEELTRVIPILVKDVEIPLALRTLRWVDLREDFESGVREILNAVQGVSIKPLPGQHPPHIKQMISGVGKLSPLASTVGLYLLRANDPNDDQERAFDGGELAGQLSLSPEELNDAIDELESAGAVRVTRAYGTAPYGFAIVEPTYLLFHLFDSFLDYKPTDDIRVALASIAGLKSANGEQLQQSTGLSVGRLNKAVDFISEYGLAEVHRFFGTSPYGFGQVTATRHTRQASAGASR
jgi:hypothetical protein